VEHISLGGLSGFLYSSIDDNVGIEQLHAAQEWTLLALLSTVFSDIQNVSHNHYIE